MSLPNSLLLLLLPAFALLPSSLASGTNDRFRFPSGYNASFLPSAPFILTSSLFKTYAASSCVPSTTTAAQMTTLLLNGGAGYTLSLCPSTTYNLEGTIYMSAANQEISTQGYPIDSTRAMLFVNGSTDRETGMSTAVWGACAACSGVKLSHVQINGNRADSGPYNTGGNIEMGGSVSGQIVDHVRSFDPRGWSGLHIAEGTLDCTNVTISNNDIGPCGHDAPYAAWADGISVSCRDSLVINNTVIDPTDGGIVIFGSPGSVIRNNTISVRNSTSLGGINLVDYSPWEGNFNGTLVEGNTIYGGFATAAGSTSAGPQENSAIIKIGIGIGPRIWFGSGSAELLVNFGGTVQNNILSGAFGYGVAVANAKDFTVMGNTLDGNASFIGSRGENCTTGWEQAGPIDLHLAFGVQTNTTGSVTLQSEFVDAELILLTCVVPPNSTSNSWPYGLSPGTIDVTATSIASPSISISSSSSTPTTMITSILPTSTGIPSASSSSPSSSSSSTSSAGAGRLRRVSVVTFGLLGGLLVGLAL